MKKSDYTKICPMCGDIRDTTGKYCQKCYNYLSKHPEGLYPLPPKGVIHYAKNGDPICHICGKAIRKLGNHIAFYHKMTQNEYREMFGLYHNTKLSNHDYQTIMHNYNKQYADIVVRDNLIRHGVDTRLNKMDTPKRKLGYKIQEHFIER